MNYLLDPIATWTDFVYAAVLLGLLSVGTRWLVRRLNRGLYLQEADGPVRAFMRVFAQILAPIILVLLTAIFVAIWPVVHGVIVLLILLLGFPYLRDYAAGRILRFDSALELGRPLTAGPLEGTVAHFGLTGMYVQREEGRSRVSYANLLRDGYTVGADPNRGGLFELRIELSGEEKSLTHLHHLLVETPYVMPGFEVDAPGPISKDKGEQAQPHARLKVGVHRAEHLRYLVGRLTEAGYPTTTLTS